MIYSVDSAIQRLNNQGPINLCPAVSAISFPITIRWIALSNVWTTGAMVTSLKILYMWGVKVTKRGSLNLLYFVVDSIYLCF